MARVNDNPNCPVCGDTAQREVNTDTHEMTIGCDNCGFCADTSIEFDTTGYYFWRETARYPMREGKVHRGRNEDLTPKEQLCECAAGNEESGKLEKLCKKYLDAMSRSARLDAGMALIDFVADLTKRASIYAAMRESESIPGPGGYDKHEQ